MNEQTNPEMLPDELDEQRDEEHQPPPQPKGEGEESPSPLGEGRGEGEESPSSLGEGRGEGPAVDDTPTIDIAHVKRVLEAALLATAEPLTVQQLRRLFGGQVASDNIRKVLDELRDEWSDRSIELTAVASGWRFRVKPVYQEFLDRISSDKPPRYTRAVLETLAIIAYRQPVTRGDIEDIRGVAVSPPTLKALEERGWIETVGHRETPGRPALFATTRKFLDDLNLRSLEELPPLEELQSALEPAPTLVPIEAAAAPPQQDSLIDDEPQATEEAPEPQEPEAHAG